jgi:hypothetical protein
MLGRVTMTGVLLAMGLATACRDAEVERMKVHNDEVERAIAAASAQEESFDAARGGSRV